ncbi:hypothetical protein Ddye_013934 [Dipteronia dyeriana]|uniref:RNase H type-1 domain-containing protein n=1 Tax=Dipteronia dyeriana TaxID=168575 RepID=A0AAD9X7B7_9ROSI|nr:hypothetical protein Ddye_013934 [Dipteronia dyeriana]
MAWWGVEGCFNAAANDWLYGWMSLCPMINSERAWGSLFSATIWTIWEAQNQLIFEDKAANVKQAIDMVKLRVVWWFKALAKGSQDTVQMLMLNVKLLCVEHTKPKLKKSVDWIPPVKGILKFNVDGSVRGNSGSAGIGGVLKGAYGNVLCLFSFSMGIADSNATELWAVFSSCLVGY